LLPSEAFVNGLAMRGGAPMSAGCSQLVYVCSHKGKGKVMSATPPWTCDTCGRLIERVEDGWVEWLTRETEVGPREYYALRLVHTRPSSPLVDPEHPRRGLGCQHDEDSAF